MDKMHFFVNRLDEGYILTSNQKQKAVSSYNELEERIVALVKGELEKITARGNGNMMVNVEVDFNLPMAAEK